METLKYTPDQKSEPVPVQGSEDIQNRIRAAVERQKEAKAQQVIEAAKRKVETEKAAAEAAEAAKQPVKSKDEDLDIWSKGSTREASFIRREDAQKSRASRAKWAK